MADRADLHMHSVRSDGEHTPAELADLAVAAGLRAVALTDHDTIAGWREYRSACEARGVEPIPGVELSGRMGTRDAHILGYFIEADTPGLATALETFGEHRVERARRIVEKLNGLGVPLRYEDVEACATGAVIGRPHVAEALVQGGFVRAFQEAFHRYIGINSPAYEPKSAFSAEEAIALIHEAGGFAVLAHPQNHYGDDDVRDLAEMGLDGVEVIHPRHGAGHRRRFAELAEEHGLARTGGSDFHGGTRGESEVGRPHIPYEWVEALRNRR